MNEVKVIIGEKISLIASIAILWILVAIILVLSVRNNQGHIVYALDDAYIHMAIAKNFAQHGVWGVTQYGFSSSSSSLLYTFLLSVIYFLFGVNEFAPFILNIIFATLSICLIFYFLRQKGLNSLLIFMVLVFIIFFTPLPALIFSGMEHTLQILITIPFVYLSARMLSKDKSNFSDDVSLLVLGTLVTMIRYEGIFLIFIVSALFIIRKRWSFSFVLFIFGFLPIAIYGIISLSNGWFFLPNSVLLKGNMPTFSLLGLIKFFDLFVVNITQTSHIFVLVSAALILFIYQYNKQRNWIDTTIMLIILIFTSILHIMFARIGWFFRYEAYLIGLGIFVLSIGLREYMPERLSIKFDKNSILKFASITLLLILIISPLAIRGEKSLTVIPQATKNIYEQQYQMGLFLKQFYQGDSVAANDIGAVSYFGNIELLDLWGLGSLEVAKLKMEGLYNTQQIQDLTTQKKVKIAMVYDNWYKKYGGIPSNWIKVGEWKISNVVIAGDDTVSFYAIDLENEKKLIENMKIFSSNMPKDINQSGKYIDIKR